MSIALTEQPSSALRYGLLNVKPIPINEFVKIKGMRFRKKGIAFEPQKETQFESIDDFISFRYGLALGTMPIPDYFSREQVLDHFIAEAIKRLKEDKEFMEQIEKREKSLYEFVGFIKERFDNHLAGYFQAEAYRFLNSNLPLSFFAKTSMYINTYQKYLSLVKRIVRRFQIKSNLPGIRNKFNETEKQLNIMKSQLSPLIDKMDLCSNASMSLKLFVTTWSAEKLEEIGNPKFLDINKLDQTYFQEYCLTYDSEIKNMRRMLFDVAKRFEPELFAKEIVSENSTSLMLSKLLSSNSVLRV
jgi:hypothetical protein